MELCGWFAACGNQATVIVDHPLFPNGVPTCDRCVAVAKLEPFVITLKVEEPS